MQALTKYAAALLVTLGAMTLAAEQAKALQIVVRYSRYTANTYDVGYSRQHAPNSFEGSGSHRDVSMVMANVESLKLWDASMVPATTTSRLHTILIETNQQHLVSILKSAVLAWLAVKKVKIGRPLASYIAAVSDAYARAKYAREQSTRMVQNLSDSAFNQANALIREFSSVRQEAVAAYGAAPFASYPPLASLNWYYEVRYSGRLYKSGAFSDRNQMANHYNNLKRSYPSMVLLKYYAQ